MSDLLLAIWRLQGTTAGERQHAVAGRSARAAYADLKEHLQRPDPPLCICVEGGVGAGKTTCCAAAFRDAGVLASLQLWDSRECATATLNSTQIVRDGGKRRKATAARKTNDGRRKFLPSVGIDLFVREGEEEEEEDRDNIVILVDNIHEVLQDDKSAFATMLRTLRSAHGSNTQFSSGARRRTCVVVTLDKEALDQRLYAQLRRECVSTRIVRVEHPTAAETLEHLRGLLPPMTDDEDEVLRRCAESSCGVRSTLSAFRDAVVDSERRRRGEDHRRHRCPEEKEEDAIPDDAATRVARARAALGLFSAMSRAHADDEGRRDDLWRSMTEAMERQVDICERGLCGGGWNPRAAASRRRRC